MTEHYSLLNKFVVSFQKNKQGIFYILISASALALSQFFWKISLGSDFFFIVLGFLIAGFGMLSMIVAYRHGSLSALHPFMSVSYLLGTGLGVLLLGEKISLLMCLGLVFVIAGVVLIGGGDE